MGNPTPKNWSDTTSAEKIKINDGAILSKISYFNFADAKAYVETQRRNNDPIDTIILKQRFYEGLVQGELKDGIYQNGLDANDAAYIVENYNYLGTDLATIRDDNGDLVLQEDTLTMLS